MELELKELAERTLTLFNLTSCSDLGGALMQCVASGNTEKYAAFADLVKDLSVDWLQKIYQYYQADRKVKKQDYTPKSVAEFMAKLCGEAETVIDMCAGSGALTIQRWSANKECDFILYELDENVLPYLLFNMVLRNIACVVHHADILQEKIYKTYRIAKGERFGTVTEGTI